MSDATVDEAVGADSLPGGEGVVGARVQVDQIHHDVHRPEPGTWLDITVCPHVEMIQHNNIVI